MGVCNACGHYDVWLHGLCYWCEHETPIVCPTYRHSVEGMGLLPQGSGDAYDILYMLRYRNGRGTTYPIVYYSEQDARSASKALVVRGP